VYLETAGEKNSGDLPGVFSRFPAKVYGGCSGADKKTLSPQQG
jgi:hypothetical protein